MPCRQNHGKSLSSSSGGISYRDCSHCLGHCSLVDEFRRPRRSSHAIRALLRVDHDHQGESDFCKLFAGDHVPESCFIAGYTDSYSALYQRTITSDARTSVLRLHDLPSQALSRCSSLRGRAGLCHLCRVNKFAFALCTAQYIADYQTCTQDGPHNRTKCLCSHTLKILSDPPHCYTNIYIYPHPSRKAISPTFDIMQLSQPAQVSSARMFLLHSLIPFIKIL